MLNALKDFLKSVGLDGDKAGTRSMRDPRVAAAAILSHVAEADGSISPAELAELTAALEDEFDLDPAEAARIAGAGRRADAEAVDLFRFTNVLMQSLDERQRAHFVELLWKVVYADGAVHELEDNTIWRVAELLGVSARERMLAKREAASRAATRPETAEADREP